MKINTSITKIKEVLNRGVENIYPTKKDLERVLLSGKKLRLYCGYDPSTPTLHLGHMITFLKLSQFQELGHEVIMLIGDFTGMIGDPADKLATRKRLSREEVFINSKNYKKLASKILKFTELNPTKILYNNSWLGKLTFSNLIELAANFTVQQMIVRDIFQERIRKKRPIFLHEFLYPLAQAYDSVAMDVDLEVGGNDQTFNMLCGRDLMKILKKKEKFVLTTKLLTDPTGKKMGKTEGNIIPMDTEPKDMYGRIMSWPDSIVKLGFELCTKVPLKKIEEIYQNIKKGKITFRDAKARLAREITTLCHDKKAALVAEKEFNKVFKERKLPSKIPKISVSQKSLNILDLLVKTKLTPSKSEAKRLILQKGVKINGKTEGDWRKIVQIKKGMIIQVGKRRFIKII